MHPYWLYWAISRIEYCSHGNTTRTHPHTHGITAESDPSPQLPRYFRPSFPSTCSPLPETSQLLLLIYGFKFRSAFPYCLFSALNTPRSAIPAVAKVLFPLVTVNFDLWPLNLTYMVKVNQLDKCLSTVSQLYMSKAGSSKNLTARLRAARTFPALASRTKRYQSFINFGLLHYQ